MNRLEFIRFDLPKPSVERKVWPLVSFILANINYLPYVCEGLLTFQSSESINSIDAKRKKTRFDVWINNFIFNNDKDYNSLDDFKKAFLNIYNTKKHEELSNRRGMVLELLISNFVRPRYNRPYKYEQGCLVKLKSQELCTERRKTVDIAGWNGKIAELYETKVGPNLFGSDVIELLCLIRDKIYAAEIDGIIGCVTMANRNLLENKLKAVGDEYNLSYLGLALFGKDELLKLREEPIIA